MDWFIGVSTAPRNGTPLLSGTLESLKSAGWDRTTILAEPDSNLQGVSPDHIVCRNLTRLWTWENFLNGIRMGVESGSQKIAIVQDDLKIALGWRVYLEETIEEKNAVWSPYTPGHGTDRIGIGWCAIEERYLTSTYGACFYVMTIQTARLLLATLPKKTMRIGTDGWMSKWCLKQKVPLIHHSPSLVQHIGHYSTMDDKRERYEEFNENRNATVFCADVRVIHGQRNSCA